MSREGMMSRESYRALLLVAWSFCAAGRAYAQQSTEADAVAARYKAAIDVAIEEFELGNFVEAEEQFRRAHELSPSARTLRGLGVSAFELRRYDQAVPLLEQALASPVKPLEGALREQTEQVLETARRYVAYVELTVRPETARISVDATDVQLPESGALQLSVGEHAFEFSAAGYAAQRRVLRLRGGQRERLEVALSAQESARALARPADDIGTHPWFRRWWVWTAAGVVLTGAVVGLAVGLGARHDVRTVPVRTSHTPQGISAQPLWAF